MRMEIIARMAIRHHHFEQRQRRGSARASSPERSGAGQAEAIPRRAGHRIRPRVLPPARRRSPTGWLRRSKPACCGFVRYSTSANSFGLEPLVPSDGDGQAANRGFEHQLQRRVDHPHHHLPEPLHPLPGRSRSARAELLHDPRAHPLKPAVEVEPRPSRGVPAQARRDRTERARERRDGDAAAGTTATRGCEPPQPPRRRASCWAGLGESHLLHARVAREDAVSVLSSQHATSVCRSSTSG